MKKWIHEKTSSIFFITLIVYVFIWLTVSYIGVYVTYVAGPILLISGASAWFSMPNEDA